MRALAGGKPSRRSHDGSPAVTYCTIADERYFVGAAALVNSLRLTGNSGDILIMDSGLTTAQRTLLEDEATVVPIPGYRGGFPRPAALAALAEMPLKGTFVSLDSDMIVTSSLADVVEQAESGMVCVFAHGGDVRARWFPEWQDGFELRAPLRREAYVNAGFVAFSVSHWPELLQRWAETCALVPEERYFRNWDDPFYAWDQEALNALLMSEIPRSAVLELPEGREVFTEDLARVELVDSARLACRLNGRETSLLHYTWVPKPWFRGSWTRLRRGDAYVQLLPRVVLRSDVPVPLSATTLPPWLRPGSKGTVVFAAVAAVAGLRRALFEALLKSPAPVQRRLRALRRRIAPRERERKAV